MLKRLTVPTAAVLVFACCWLSAAAERAAGEEAALVLWAQGPMTRIFPHDPPPTAASRRFALSAARGETEMLQIGVHTRGFRAGRLEAAACDLVGPGGAAIPASDIDVFYAEYVPVKWSTGDQLPGDVERAAPAFFPDPLVPEWKWRGYRAVPSETLSIWVRVNVPAKAAAGEYTGAVTVTASPRDGGEYSGRIDLTVRVWDFELPGTSGFLMTNWLFFQGLSEWWEVDRWGEEHWGLIEKVADDMAYHRQNVIITPVFDLVKVRRDGEGYGYDYADFDRWCEIFFERGFRLIEGKHIRWRPRTVEVIEADGTIAEVSLGGLDDPKFLAFIDSFFSALWRHLGERGWRESYIQHVADEPKPEDLPSYEKLARAVRAAAPGIRTIDALHRPGFANITDIPVPQEGMYDATVAESGRPAQDIWVYYCTAPAGPWPNRFIDYTLIRVRIFTWICQRKGIPGFLHWGYNYWGSGYDDKRVINPWDDGTANNWQCGDPFVVYPPRDEDMTRDWIIPSIRWEMIREAMEDWEYLRMTVELAEAGSGEAKAILEEVDARVVPDWTTHTRDHEYLQSVRDRMGDLLSGKESQ